MFQYVNNLWYWFINLLFKKNKPKQEDSDENDNDENNKINIISCTVRYIKDN